ncbi:hypothetical protein GTO27_06535 [Candidatus Bathyarchaeota archaeon]|nr:hypothetical protein [Candidatus Bathyarchaeota archaeon]
MCPVQYLTEKIVPRWRIEAITLVFIVSFIFLCFYLSFLSFQTVDEAVKKQLVFFAALFLVAGITIFAALTVYAGIKKAFLNIKDAAKVER